MLQFGSAATVADVVVVALLQYHLRIDLYLGKFLFVGFVSFRPKVYYAWTAGEKKKTEHTISTKRISRWRVVWVILYPA